LGFTSFSRAYVPDYSAASRGSPFGHALRECSLRHPASAPAVAPERPEL